MGEATLHVEQLVQAVQQDAEHAVEGIFGFEDVIARVQTSQATIASAVEEQATVTANIGRRVTETASAATEIADNTAAVALAARVSSVSVRHLQARHDD